MLLSKIVVVGRKLVTALAVAAILFPAAAQAAEVAMGAVTSVTGALAVRDGNVVPATAGVNLYSSDRLISRAGASANVTPASNRGVTVGASAMLPMSAGSCAQPNLVTFDQGCQPVLIGRNPQGSVQPAILRNAYIAIS